MLVTKFFFTKNYIFTGMSPIDYIKDNVSVTSARKLLYGCVFKRLRIRADEEHEENLILGGVKINSYFVISVIFALVFL